MKKEDVRKAYEGWEKLIDPGLLKPSLMLVSAYLIAYEMLKNHCLVDRVRSFYVHGFDEHGDKVSSDYQIKVLDLDKSPMKASALWFKSLDALTQEDVDLLDHLRAYRNKIAHNLINVIFSAEESFRNDLFEAMLLLIKKIDIYWIRNVEMDSDPELAVKDVSDAEICSGNMILLHLLAQTAFGDQAKAKDFLASCRSEMERKINETE